jgi:acyl-CoA thioesterase II
MASGGSVSAARAEQARDFAALIALERVEPGRFRSRFSDLDYQGGHMFGGQIVAQALAAALQTLGDKHVHSLHGYFLRPGDVHSPIDYSVETMRDGRNFATRRVRAEQGGKALYEMLCSAGSGSQGPFDHQDPVPLAVPPPESLATMAHLLNDPAYADCRDAIRRLLPMDMVDCRPVDPERLFRPGSGGPLRVWLRMRGLEGAIEPAMQACMLAYLQDYWIAYAPWSRQSEPFELDSPSVASLDSNLWLHRPTSAGWLLYDFSSPTGSGGIGAATGRLIDRQGRVVASSAQEVLFRCEPGAVRRPNLNVPQGPAIG